MLIPGESLCFPITMSLDMQMVSGLSSACCSVGVVIKCTTYMVELDSSLTL